MDFSRLPLPLWAASGMLQLQVLGSPSVNRDGRPCGGAAGQRKSLALLALPSLAHAQAKVTMGLSHQLPPAHHIAKVVEAFAADVKARTNGEVEVKVFGASQAHKPAENFPAVARGAIESAIVVNFQWGNTIPEMNVTVIPYFFTDLEKLKEVDLNLERKKR